MRICVAAIALTGILLATVSPLASAAGDSASLTSDGWQQLKGSDTAGTPVAASAPVPDGNAEIPARTTVAERTPEPTPAWTIRAGYPIGLELKRLGAPLGWTVVWQMPRDVIAASTANFTGDFPTVVADVVKTLAENGALIHAQIYDGNRTVVVDGPGVTPQQ